MSTETPWTQIIVVGGTARARSQFRTRLDELRCGDTVDFTYLTCLAYARTHKIPTSNRWTASGLSPQFERLLWNTESRVPTIVLGPMEAELDGRAVLVLVFSTSSPICEKFELLAASSPGLRLAVVTFDNECGHLDSPGGAEYAAGDRRDLQSHEADAVARLAGYPAERCTTDLAQEDAARAAWRVIRESAPQS